MTTRVTEGARRDDMHDKTFETFDGRVYEVFRILYFSDECNRLKTAFSRLKYPKHLVNSTIKSFVDSKVCDRQQPISPVKETDDRVRVVYHLKTKSQQKLADIVTAPKSKHHHPACVC